MNSIYFIKPSINKTAQELFHGTKKTKIGEGINLLIMRFPCRSALGAILKRRPNILRGEWGLKFECCKILEGRS